MKNTLIVLNYQREIPPFMQTILHYATKIFERVIYITPEMCNDNRSGCNADSLEVIQLPRSMWRKALLKSPVTLANNETFQILSLGKKDKKLNKGFFKNLLTYAVCAEMLKEGFFKTVRDANIDLSDCVVLCTWFDVCAYAANLIKKQLPQIPVVSFAHAFEVKTQVNPYVYLSYNLAKHLACDKIFFISETVMEQYEKKIPHYFNDSISLNNLCVRYLGSKKSSKKMSLPSTDGIFRILSCSSVVAVKRIEKIVDILSLVDKVEIKWTHIGDGPLLQEIQTAAKNKLENKPKVKYEFLGHFENERVHKFYSEQPVDLFINVSDSEGLPVSIMESMSYGIPVIATDVGGTREIVNEKTGFLLPKDFQPNEVAKIITNFSLLSKEEKQKYREAAYDMWETKFDGEKNSLKILDELHNM